MPKTLINQNTADNYTDTGGANINSVYQSRGGWVTLPSTVYAQIQHSPEGAQQGQEQWSEEFVLPSGAHYLQPGLIGIRFRSFTTGNPIAVSAALFFKDEPAMQLGGSGISTPSTSVASLNFQHNGAAVATENTLDFEDPANPSAFVWTVVDTPGVKVAVTPVWNNPTIFPHPISTGPATASAVGTTTGFYADGTGIFITAASVNGVGLTYGISGQAFPNFRIQDAGIAFGGSTTAIDTVMGWNAAGQLFLVQLPFGGTNTSSLILDNLWAGASQNTSPTFVAIQTSYGAITNHTFEVLANGQHNWGTGSAAVDTNLFRSSVGHLTLQNALYANNEIVSAMGGDGGGFNAVGATTGSALNSGGVLQVSRASGNVAFTVTNPGTTTDWRFAISSDGQLNWAAANTASDVSLARTGANTLKFQTATVISQGGLLSDATSFQAGVGYTVGAGSSVTQLTSLTTGVTINNLTGVITTATVVFTAGVIQTFAVTNSTVAVTDTVVLSFRNQNWNQPIWLWCNHVQNGRFDISMFNLGGASNNAASSINFAVIKGSQT